MSAPRIALISATPLAIGPATAAIGEALPDATVWNLLDDRLLADAQAQGGVTAPLAARMDGLIDLALAGGADGVLLTCSQYGARAEERDAGVVAVLSADGPLFAEAVARKPSRVLLVASLDSAASDSSRRLADAFAAAGAATQLDSVVAPAAAQPLPAARLVDVLADAIAGADAGYDVIVLAQFSLAPAAAGLADRLGVPVLDGPHAAARRLVAEIGWTG